MNLLLEQPIPIAVVGVLALVVLFAVLIKSGKRWVIGLMVLVALATGGLLALEHFVLTERERVELVLFDIATKMEANDEQGVIAHISPKSGDVRSQAKTALRAIIIEEAKIKRNLEIEMHLGQNPPMAIAKFNGVIIGGDKIGQYKNQRYARFFTVTFRQEDGQWKVRSYTDADPRKGM